MPATDLSSRVNSRRPGIIGGFLFGGARTSRMRRAGPGLRIGQLIGQFDEGIEDNAYCGVEPAGKCLLLWPRRRGIGGWGWPECVQLDQGYTLVVLVVDLAMLSFANIA